MNEKDEDLQMDRLIEQIIEIGSSVHPKLGLTALSLSLEALIDCSVENKRDTYLRLSRHFLEKSKKVWEIQ